MTRQQLQQTWQTLGLSEGDVGAIERRINAEIETHQAKLRQYEQEFTEAVQQEYPLSAFKRSQLRQRHQALNLTAENVTAIETRVVASQELIKSLIRQPSSAQRIQPAQERITRQKFLKWAGWGGVGLVTALAGCEIFKGQSPTPESTISVAEPKYIPPTKEASKALGLPLWTVEFETVTVDEKGQVIKRDPNKQAKFFKEDLGNGITLDMVEILGGSFNMGSPPDENDQTKNEEPQHAVNVPAFFIGKFEVTQEQYQQIMGSNPSDFKGAKRPVEHVSWNDAVDFCKKLSQKAGRKYRLPSEAEWEYACRAGTTTPFHFGETITTELANYNGYFTYASAPQGKYRQETTEVGSFPPNAFGLYDMHANVWEWCQDTGHGSYEGAPSDGSAWIDTDQNRMLRGGSWTFIPIYCRSASRLDTYGDVGIIGDVVGFRVVCAVGRTL
ncbi:formylglycine-generating enzyme family protein [Nostoc sp.]|uniref:formylglycine-generating enzyme family protein n=1 Tax=Nostoc sp. TaxID=1180 RepID=UPI002FF5E6EE